MTAHQFLFSNKRQRLSIFQSFLITCCLRGRRQALKAILTSLWISLSSALNQSIWSRKNTSYKKYCFRLEKIFPFFNLGSRHCLDQTVETSTATKTHLDRNTNLRYGFEMHIWTFFSNLRLGKTQAKEAIRHGWSCVQGSRWVLGSVRRNASVRIHTSLKITNEERTSKFCCSRLVLAHKDFNICRLSISSLLIACFSKF